MACDARQRGNAIQNTHSLYKKEGCLRLLGSMFTVPCDSDESDAAPEFSIVIGGEFSRTHDIRPADI